MASKKNDISVAIATFNEAKNLRGCLDSVQGWVNEIVVVDGGSTDETVAIAQQYDARIIKTDNPAIFHINKQKALDASRSDWILQLDADEVVTQELRDEIQAIVVNPKSFDGYYLPRKNYFLGHWLSKGGQYPDFVIRLFRRGKGEFPAKNVHEQIHIEGSIGHAKHALEHFTSRTKEDYWRKADAYTTLTAKAWKKEGITIQPLNFFRYMIWMPVVTFLKLFVRHKGFVDGWWGFLFAWYSALHFPIAYQKLSRNST
jgi:glycosyltransferase involved in cell wall biosynthesis